MQSPTAVALALVQLAHDPRSLCSAMRVCKSWRRAARDEGVWRVAMEQVFGGSSNLLAPDAASIGWRPAFRREWLRFGPAAAPHAGRMVRLFLRLQAALSGKGVTLQPGLSRVKKSHLEMHPQLTAAAFVCAGCEPVEAGVLGSLEVYQARSMGLFEASA